jgi:S-formylglutathione hydrolase FrmB
MVAVRLRETLAQLHGDRVIRPVIVVAIDMLHDRMGTYGLSDRRAGRSLPGDSRFGLVGARAHDYSEWVAHTLVPYIDAHYRTEAKPGARAMLGWSLGGLNAFNLGWQYPDVFGRVGAFSPSFWLAADRSSPVAVQHTRLAQRMVDGVTSRPDVRFFFAVGGKEETSDRDGDGIIDAVDDTRDLMQGWQGDDGASLPGLAQRGYSVDMDWANAPARTDVAYVLLPDGEHNQASWARMLPLFLRWAYATHAPPSAVDGP